MGSGLRATTSTARRTANALVLACALLTAAWPIAIRAAPSPGTGGAAVHSVDAAAASLTGACFELWRDAGGGTRGEQVAASQRCDAPRTTRLGPEDDRVDGTVGWSDLAPGAYLVVETIPPRGYEALPDAPLAVTAGALAELSLTHYRAFALTVLKTDAAGRPLSGACFQLTNQANQRDTVFLCDGGPGAGGPGDNLADGILVLAPPNQIPLASASYTLHEWLAPDGYTAQADQTVNLNAGRATKLTVVNTTGAAGTGGPGALGEVTSLEFEMESSIEIRTFAGFPVRSGRTMASGRIVLENDGSGTWHGTGSLASVTTSESGATCPSVKVVGEGTYDWVVRNVHAGPNLGAEGFSVSMDSGPEVENPDTSTSDFCTDKFDSPVNTWENLFFDVYRSRYQAFGFLVEGWTLVGGTDAWASGGLIAEASWSGDCTTALVLDCTDSTTLRLYGRAEPVAATASPAQSPEPSGGAGGATPSPSSATGEPSPLPVGPSPSFGVGITPPTGSCGDFLSCNAVLLGIVSIGIVLALGALGFVWLRTLGARRVVPLPSPPDASEFQKFDKAPPDFGKIAPDASEFQKFDKAPPDFGKIAPDASEFQKFDKAPPDFGKIAPDASEFQKFDKAPPEFDK